MITQDRLKQLIHYDPESGVFTRLVSHRTDRIGVAPGARNTNGHVQIRVDGVLYMAHRLAWLYVYGLFPNNQLDHINGVRSDNRISNLRDCVTKQNCENKKLYKNNKTGHRGVYYDSDRGKFRVFVGHNMGMVYVGCFDTAEAAGVAAKATRDELFTHHKTSYSA